MRTPPEKKAISPIGCPAAISATELLTPDLQLLAQAIGANYLYFDGDAENTLREVIRSNSVTLVEVSIGDSNAIRMDRAKGLIRNTARRALKKLRR